MAETKNGTNDTTVSMAQLLDTYGDAVPPRYKAGDRVTCEVVSIGKDTVFMDMGSGVDGTVDTADLLDKNGELKCKVGDSLDLYVVSVRENEIRLAAAVHGHAGGGLDDIKAAFEGRMPVEGKVKEECKGGFSIALMNKRAFCPISQMDTRYVADPSVYVGKTFDFLITEFKEGGRNIVVSRRKLQAEHATESRADFMSGLQAGAILEGRVVKVMPYGAFVELAAGIEGMVHVSEISWSRTADPAEVLSEGTDVAVKVLEVEKRDSAKPRISLSIKQATESPWERASLVFNRGDRVKGRVVNCLDFGAFVEIAPGVEGLVHVSELSYLKRVKHPSEMVAVGDEVYVVIKDLDRDSRKISLSIRDAEGDPWMDVAEKYKSGSLAEGVLEKKERFGWFVSLEAGVTGLMPNSEIGRAADPAIFDHKKAGEKVAVRIKEVNVSERKMTLSPADAESSDDWKEYSGGGTMGSLADKLKTALEKKETRRG